MSDDEVVDESNDREVTIEWPWPWTADPSTRPTNRPALVTNPCSPRMGMSMPASAMRVSVENPAVELVLKTSNQRTMIDLATVVRMVAVQFRASRVRRIGVGYPHSRSFPQSSSISGNRGSDLIKLRSSRAILNHSPLIRRCAKRLCISRSSSTVPRMAARTFNVP